MKEKKIKMAKFVLTAMDKKIWICLGNFSTVFMGW